MVKTYSVIASGLLFSSVSFASILPPNNLHLQDKVGKMAANGITEEIFNQLIDKVNMVYEPIVEGHKAKLKWNRRWTDSTVNASASQSSGTWTVNMYGGLARRDEITQDGFMIVMCHELGHHLAGFPFVSSWAANEGQSDYFASQSCARELWTSEVEVNATFRATVSDYVKTQCDSVWTVEADQNLCYRTAAAVKSTADLLAALDDKTVKFDVKDPKVVSSTSNSHPAAQCRLDTYFSGALCDVEFNREIIPAKDLGSSRNSAQGEEQAAMYSCHQKNTTVGVRPLCWFKPRT